MSEYIIWESDKTETTDYLGVKHDVSHFEKREEIVRCRDCKYGIDGGEYCAEDCADSWDWRNVEPDGFCAWGERADNFATCKCGEDIETNGRESVSCPSCGGMVRA